MARTIRGFFVGVLVTLIVSSAPLARQRGYFSVAEYLEQADDRGGVFSMGMHTGYTAGVADGLRAAIRFAANSKESYESNFRALRAVQRCFEGRSSVLGDVQDRLTKSLRDAYRSGRGNEGAALVMIETACKQ